jgi:hypothetical protein
MDKFCRKCPDRGKEGICPLPSGKVMVLETLLLAGAASTAEAWAHGGVDAEDVLAAKESADKLRDARKARGQAILDCIQWHKDEIRDR